MVDMDDESRLKLEQMQVNIDKTKLEIEKLGSDQQNKPIEINIVCKKKATLIGCFFVVLFNTKSFFKGCLKYLREV